MAASLKPARLWLRAARGPRQAVWIILDKGKQVPTGCRENDLAGAQDALAAHLAATHRPAAPKSGNPADLPVGDVLTVYMQDKQEAVASPAELGQRVSALLDYFGEMTLGQVNASTC